MKLDLKNEIWRKSVHISGIFFLPILFWNREFFVTLLILFLVGYLIVEWQWKKGKKIPLLTALTHKSKRDHESGRLAKGPILLVIAGVTTPYLFGVEPAAIGLAQIFVGDVASTLVGMKLGTRKLPYSKRKSWAGSLAFFLTATLVDLFLVPLPQAILLAAVGTLIESFPFSEIDNLTVPVGVGLAAKSLSISLL